MATTQQVAHAWANQTGKHRKGHSLSYDGTRLYSYKTCIADFELTPTGLTIAVFSTRKYSMTTTKHLTYAKRAASQFEQFETPNPFVGISLSDWERYVANAKGAADKAKRARIHGDWHLNNAGTHMEKANRLNELFNFEQAEISFESLGVAFADVKARIAAVAEAERLREEQQKREYFAKQAESRAKWLAGESVRFHGADENGGALLRVKDDRLETSLGASVPLDHAIRIFRLVNMDRADVWIPKTPEGHVGDFYVDEIRPDKSIKVGCHTIYWSEIERIAKQLNLMEMA